MSSTVIEVALTLFWLAYVGLHLWLLRAEPPEEGQLILEAKE